MKGSRGFRIAFGVLVLAVFVAYFALRFSVSPRTSDFDDDHAVVYGDLQDILNAGGTLEDYYRSDPRFADILAEFEKANEEEASAENEEPVVEPTPEPTPDPASPAGKAAALGLAAPPDIDITSWEYTLVNGDNSIGQYVPESLAYLNQTVDETDIQTAYNANRCPVDERIAQAVLDMALGCKEAGNPVYLSSGYRSYTDQDANFQRICANNGITDGKDINGHYITMPAGCSEHQTALCVDITDVYRSIKNDEIENTDTCKWLIANCAEYGFIHRFPEEKMDVTGVMNEGWHFRYVGKEVAAYIMDNGLCLEEFVALYNGVVDTAENGSTEEVAG